MDPFLAVQRIRQAGCERWGWERELPPADNWRGKKYLPWKPRMIKYPLACSEDCGPLTLQIDDAAEQEVYVSAANWYGGESRPVEMNAPRAIRPTDEEVMHG